MIGAVQVLGQPAMRLVAADGAEATVLLHGGQLVSWIPAGDQERLYLSPRAVAGPGASVRGGIPVIFPQFAQRGAGPRHGFARDRAWQWVEGSERGGAATGVLRLVDDEATQALWPHPFELELTFSLAGLRLDVELAVTHTGHGVFEPRPFEFTAALHTYLRVGDVTRARLQRLAGLRYEDMVAGGHHQQEFDSISFVGEIDRVYSGLRGPVELSCPLGRLMIETEDFPDLVVWNPGPAKAAALADLPDEDWRQMLCVEAGAIETPVRLAPGETWTARQGFELPG